MDYNNRTILITGLIIASIVAMYLSYQDIALAIVSGLVGYLSKDIVSVDPVDEQISSVDDNIKNDIDEDTA